MTEHRKKLNDLLKVQSGITYAEAKVKIPGLKYHIYQAARAAKKLGPARRHVEVEHGKDEVLMTLNVNQEFTIKLVNGQAIGTLCITKDGVSFTNANKKKRADGRLKWPFLALLSEANHS